MAAADANADDASFLTWGAFEQQWGTATDYARVFTVNTSPVVGPWLGGDADALTQATRTCPHLVFATNHRRLAWDVAERLRRSMFLELGWPDRVPGAREADAQLWEEARRPALELPPSTPARRADAVAQRCVVDYWRAVERFVERKLGWDAVYKHHSGGAFVSVLPAIPPGANNGRGVRVAPRPATTVRLRPGETVAEYRVHVVTSLKSGAYDSVRRRLERPSSPRTQSFPPARCALPRRIADYWEMRAVFFDATEAAQFAAQGNRGEAVTVIANHARLSAFRKRLNDWALHTRQRVGRDREQLRLDEGDDALLRYATALVDANVLPPQGLVSTSDGEGFAVVDVPFLHFGCSRDDDLSPP